MSKSASTATLFPAWKQEVNRRVAAHMSHKTPSAREFKATHDGHPSHGSRAAQAAARVAERYAHAPSYSEILAEEARAAMRAAEAASKAARQAQAAVQYMLDGLEAAAAPESVQLPGFVASNAPVSGETPDSQLLNENPFSSAGKQHVQAGWPKEPALKPAEDLQTPPSPEAFMDRFEDPRGADIGEPIYANLIQFPRQMVATRRLRPRRAEGPLAAAQVQSQLSIFEVDPGTISTLPAPEADEPAAPEWMRAELTSIAIQQPPEEDLLEESAPQAPPRDAIDLVSMSRRFMALVVDVSLILAACLLVALPFASHARHISSLRIFELAAAIVVLAVGVAYQVLFLVLARSTPGMRYAGIALSTIDGLDPNRAQRFRRLAAFLLSVLSLGLGLAWALFDDDHLMGHDRLSKTYLRKR